MLRFPIDHFLHNKRTLAVDTAAEANAAEDVCLKLQNDLEKLKKSNALHCKKLDSLKNQMTTAELMDSVNPLPARFGSLNKDREIRQQTSASIVSSNSTLNEKFSAVKKDIANFNEELHKLKEDRPIMSDIIEDMKSLSLESKNSIRSSKTYCSSKMDELMQLSQHFHEWDADYCVTEQNLKSIQMRMSESVDASNDGMREKLGPSLRELEQVKQEGHQMKASVDQIEHQLAVTRDKVTKAKSDSGTMNTRRKESKEANEALISQEAEADEKMEASIAQRAARVLLRDGNTTTLADLRGKANEKREILKSDAITAKVSLRKVTLAATKENVMKAKENLQCLTTVKRHLQILEQMVFDRSNEKAALEKKSEDLLKQKEQKMLELADQANKLETFKLSAKEKVNARLLHFETVKVDIDKRLKERSRISLELGTVRSQAIDSERELAATRGKVARLEEEVRSSQELSSKQELERAKLENEEALRREKWARKTQEEQRRREDEERKEMMRAKRKSAREEKERERLRKVLEKRQEQKDQKEREKREKEEKARLEREQKEQQRRLQEEQDREKQRRDELSRMNRELQERTSHVRQTLGRLSQLDVSQPPIGRGTMPAVPDQFLDDSLMDTDGDDDDEDDDFFGSTQPPVTRNTVVPAKKPVVSAKKTSQALRGRAAKSLEEEDDDWQSDSDVDMDQSADFHFLKSGAMPPSRARAGSQDSIISTTVSFNPNNFVTSTPMMTRSNSKEDRQTKVAEPTVTGTTVGKATAKRGRGATRARGRGRRGAK